MDAADTRGARPLPLLPRLSGARPAAKFEAGNGHAHSGAGRERVGEGRDGMKIVLVNRYFHPDQSATSRMVSSLAFALARRGFQVTAVASRSFQGEGNAVLPPRERIHGVEVHRLATSGFGRRRLTGRSADYATFHLSAARWLLANARRGDACVVCTDPPLLSVSAALPLKLRGAHLINWVMDLFPETAIELGLMSGTGAASRAALALRDRSLGSAALTICPMDAMTRYLAKRAGDSRFVTVHHWANDGEIRPVDRAGNTLRWRWGLNDAFVVGYSGNFGRAHEFSTLLAAAHALRREPIVFLMIGDGAQRPAVEAEARRLGLSNIVFKPYQPSTELSESLGASDVHIVSLLPSLEHCVVPSKLYGILAAARPTLFVGDRGGELATLLKRHGCGAAVEPGDADGLAALIMRLKDAPDECRAMGQRALALMRNEYSLEAGVARWIRAVQHLLPPSAYSPAAATAREVAT